MFVNTQMIGIGLAFPDVCLTPAPPAPAPVPIPYPNIWLLPTTVGFIPNVLVLCCPLHTLASTAPMSNGDNPGVAMGVASGTVMGPGRYTLGSNTCLCMGMPITRLTSTTMQNSTNAIGVQTVPSQPLVLDLMP
ncbi:uncharacterized protein DUF4150 [Panacagrimonas perspica]|uniref:Uncharacterized protein DUF4150 n=1 Tax=Panacagrimonas perspica TaxID=381431 RepID=A0A4R7PD35_9GAMM|nr:DUF4150 domain-containing protein [Panacagrimonas perspica]TDU31170.1 uncharacterized protein DUF4150 [Panacagrimonas perspica]